MSTSAERMRRLRAKQRLALAPPEGGPPVRSADELLAPAVEASIEALGLAEADAAVAQLARQLARQMDEARDPAWAARWLGPELQRCLEALGATPAARARMTPPTRPAASVPSRLDRLRQARMEHRPGAG